MSFESYELGRLNPPASDAVEEHLLICESCRVTDNRLHVFISAMRSGLRAADPNVVVWELHSTEKGLIEIWVERIHNHWVSRRLSRFSNSSTLFPEMRGALRDCADTFRELFPHHVCGNECSMKGALS
jgi:hypothetical protein